ncbi:MAG: hypothetical protein BWY59_01575 [Verrucomicrobia bacterium ADurb.Bin345]|nr:MAG: hypothetical protein BWY59_01575 [Verrucomicrobia bacterium ADurb.Bin345]
MARISYAPSFAFTSTASESESAADVALKKSSDRFVTASGMRRPLRSLCIVRRNAEQSTCSPRHGQMNGSTAATQSGKIKVHFICSHSPIFPNMSIR